jgi:NTE family protein
VSGDKTVATKKRKINLALQGGGSHGAFTWGVLDRILEEDDIEITAISGTSAGAMNAVVVGEGLMEGGHQKAREQLDQFWNGMGDMADKISPFKRTPWQQLTDDFSLQYSPMYEMSLAISRMMSPYQLNPFGYNPLRDALLELIDFERVRKSRKVKLFINTTHVATGGLRCFREHELTVDMVLASGCLPYLFQTPIIDGEGYWDGGYIANPAIEPMTRATGTCDALIVQLNPIVRKELPKTSHEITDRLNEITFNASLVTELRFIGERNRLIENGELKSERHNLIHLHMIHGDEELGRFPPSSKLLSEKAFLVKLKALGRDAADEWLRKKGSGIGKRSTFNYQRLVTAMTQESDEPPMAEILAEHD